MNHKAVLSQRIRDHMTVESIHENFIRYEGKTIALLARFQPSPNFLEYHRDKIFVA